MPEPKTPDTLADRRARAKAAAARVPVPTTGAPTLGSQLEQRIADLETAMRDVERRESLSVVLDTGFRRDIDALQRDLARAVWQKGEPGDRGPAGESIRGPAGAPSTVPGPIGPRGASAYEVAVAEGYKGTAQAWLETLRGPPGPASTVPGPKGDPGPASTVPGPKGEASTVPGPKGDPGPRGLRGLESVVQPASSRAKALPKESTALPEKVACPACGTEQDLKATMGSAFGHATRAMTGCPCGRQFNVTAQGVALRCTICGFHETAEHICAEP